MERSLFIEGEVRLFGMLFLPEAEHRKSTGFVVVHPFAEEKKSAHHTLVELSRELYYKGYAVLMIDLRGCGDSEGSFAHVQLSDWLDDIGRALETLKLHTGLPNLGIIGLRFGAFLSMCYSKRHSGVLKHIWIEPVVYPVDYLRKSLRHKQMKELCTGGVVISNRDVLLQSLEDEKSVDFDGYEIGSGLFMDLSVEQEKQNLADIPEYIRECVVVSVSMSGKTSKTVQEICAVGEGMKQISVKMELFWNKVEDVDSTELISQITDYVIGNY